MSYILVTGASGFVGSCLCEGLLSLGYKVVGIGRKDAYNSTLRLKERGFLSQATLSHKNFKYERLELKNLNENSLKNYEFSLAFHLASMVEYASLEYLEYLEYTITPTLNLIDFGGIVYELAYNALENKDIELFGRGRILRNIIHIKDAIQALILALKAQNLKPYELFVIGSKGSQTTHTIAQTLIHALHSPSKIILSDKPSPNPFNSALDCTKAQNLLSFSPPSITDGLQKYANELLHHKKEQK